MGREALLIINYSLSRIFTAGGYSLQSFLFVPHKKGFPLLSLLGWAVELFLAFIGNYSLPKLPLPKIILYLTKEISFKKLENERTNLFLKHRIG
jgi:hypothetical protein